jgi:hypothetical protein
LVDRVEPEPLGDELGAQRAGLDEPGRLAQDLAVMGAALAGQQREQGEHAGVGGGAERQRRERVAAPAEATHHVTEPAHGEERGVEAGPPGGVVDQIEAAATGVAGDVVGDRQRAIDRRGAELLDRRGARRGGHREHAGAGCARDLDRNLADATDAEDQHALARADRGAIDFARDPQVAAAAIAAGARRPRYSAKPKKVLIFLSSEDFLT